MDRLTSIGTALILVVVPIVSAAAAFDGYGEWRGQAQYLIEGHGAQAPLFHEVTPLTIRIDADGKIVGASNGNGCRLLGLAIPMANNVMSIDVTLTGCAHAALNRRITGTAAHYSQDKRLNLNLFKVDTSTRPVTSFKVGGSLRR